MKGLGVTARTLAICLLLAGAALADQVIEIAAEAGKPVLRTATSRNLLLTLPERFFRAKGETAFTTPYIADLYYTTDGGKTWQDYGLFKDLDKPFEFTAESEGRYGFFVTLLDQKGNHDILPESGTPPQVTVLVDWTPPEVTLEAPKGGDVVGAKPFGVKWKASDAFMAPNPVTVEYSADDGTTWKEVTKGAENTGAYSWTVPEGLNARILVRVTAVDEVGHSTTAATASPVLVDTTPPTVTLTGPTLSASGEVPLDVTADDGEGSGVAQVKLWLSQDNGVTWSPSGTAAGGQPLVFKSTTGKYALFATGVDKAGNESPAPKPGQAPQVTLEINTTTPLVRLKTLVSGGYISGTSEMPIEWEAVSPKPAERPVSIFLSPDGGNAWSAVATDIANSGTFLWTVPPINSANCILKIVTKDASGTEGAAESTKTFTIDSTKPTSAIGIPPAALSQPLGDLSTVLRPKAAQQGEGQAGPPQGAPQAEAPAPAPAAGATPTAPSGAAQAQMQAETMPWSPEKTPAVAEPWTTPREEGTGLERLPLTATEEEVLKAGFAAYKANQLPIAKEYFRRAAEMAPKDGRPHAALGRIYAREAGFNYSSQKEAYDAALYEFEKALSLSGDDADVYNDMGYVLLATKRYKDAEKAFTKATKFGEKPIYWYNLGYAFFQEKKIDQAGKAFGRALESDPEMADANFMMGRVGAAQGNWKASKEHFRKAVDVYGPDSPLGKIALAGIQTAREKLGEVEPEPTNTSIRQKLDRIR